MDPDLPILDAHHHLWDRSGFKRAPSLSLDTRGWGGQRLYLLPDYMKDLENCGHRVLGSVYVDAHSFYRPDGPLLWRALGEVEEVQRLSDTPAARRYGIAAGIVANGQALRHGRAEAEPIMRAMKAAAPNLRGVRFMTTFEDQSPGRIGSGVEHPEVLSEAKFREAFSVLEELDLSFDAWVYSTQLHQVEMLARAFPRVKIVVNHLGGPLGREVEGEHPHPGPVQPPAVHEEWCQALPRLAACPNVYMKLSGFAMPLLGAEYNQQTSPPSSAQVATHISPFVLRCIEAFGARRCMFASNVPVDKCGVPFSVLVNAWKRIARELPPEDRHWVLHRTASNFYRLQPHAAL